MRRLKSPGRPRAIPTTISPPGTLRRDPDSRGVREDAVRDIARIAMRPPGAVAGSATMIAATARDINAWTTTKRGNEPFEQHAARAERSAKYSASTCVSIVATTAIPAGGNPHRHN